MAEVYGKNQLLALIQKKLDVQVVPPIIIKQINRFILENDMTFKEIARCIVWYTEVERREIDVIYGISFVVNIREKANKYFEKLALDRQKQVEESQKIVEYQANNIIFRISSFKQPKRTPKQIDINNINVEGDETNNDN